MSNKDGLKKYFSPPFLTLCPDSDNDILLEIVNGLSCRNEKSSLLDQTPDNVLTWLERKERSFDEQLIVALFVSLILSRQIAYGGRAE